MKAVRFLTGKKMPGPLFLLLLACMAVSANAGCLTRGTGDLGVVVERASGSVQVVDTTVKTSLFRVECLGDL